MRLITTSKNTAWNEIIVIVPSKDHTRTVMNPLYFAIIDNNIPLIE